MKNNSLINRIGKFVISTLVFLIFNLGQIDIGYGSSYYDLNYSWHKQGLKKDKNEFIVNSNKQINKTESKKANATYNTCGIDQGDYEALIALRNSTGGWDNTGQESTIRYYRDSWKDPDVCNWAYVTISNGRVVALDFPVEPIQYDPPLPPVTYPNQPTNVTFYPFPAAIASFTELEALRITGNVYGEIPSFLGNMSKLKSIHLARLSLSGPLPSSLSNLIDLHELGVWDQTGYVISGGILQLHLDAQQRWRADNTGPKINGQIPSTFENLTNITGLWLNGNQMSGEIPSFIGSFSNLYYLNLGDNQFTGSIPSSLGNLRHMTTCDLYNNQLSGCIPQNLYFNCGQQGSYDWHGNPDLPNGGDFGAFCATQSGACGCENGRVIWYGDADGDGFGDINITTLSCIPLPGTASQSGDCDDFRSNVFPGASENNCDGLDNDCDGLIDEDFVSTNCLICPQGYSSPMDTSHLWSLDADGDGHAISNIRSCTNPGVGYVDKILDLNDCDDNDPLVTLASTWFLDKDGDGFPSASIFTCHSPGTGYSKTILYELSFDCDDNNPLIHPLQLDVTCDGVDDDCDGQIDDNFSENCAICQNGVVTITLLTWYLDADNDGHAASTLQSCNWPGIGYTIYLLPIDDCNDNDPNLTVIGAPCNNGNPCTAGETVQPDCHCGGGTQSNTGNNALTLNGNGYLRYPTSPITNVNYTGNYTAEFWLKTNYNLSQDIIDNYHSTGGQWKEGFFIQSFSGIMRFCFTENNPDVDVLKCFDVTPSSDGQFHHYSWVKTGQSVLLYIDGNSVVINPGFQTSGFGMIPSDPHPLSIGTANYNNPSFNGSIDEIRVWKYALSQSEIQAYQDHTLSGACLSSNLAFYLPLNQLSGNEQGLFLYDCGPPLTPTSYTGTDNDNDGYCTPVDCNDNDASVHPGAMDNTCDGLDNDCDGSIDEDYVAENCLACQGGQIIQLDKPTDYDALVAIYDSMGGPNWNRHNNWLTNCDISTWEGVTCDHQGRVIYLSLSNNKLTGSIPSQIATLDHLIYFIVESNSIGGNIPASIGNLTTLIGLGLNNNRLTGVIPPEIGNLTNLTYLNLKYNQLTGTLPPSIGNLVNLEFLDLGIDHTISALKNKNQPFKNKLFLSNNESLKINNLESRGIHQNQISGNILNEIGSLGKLTFLNLSGNVFTGTLPSSLGSLSLIEEIYLDHNNLSGCFATTLNTFCNKIYDFSANIDLPGGGDFVSFCNNNAGACINCISTTYYMDNDGDGYGNASVTKDSCFQPAGYVTNNTDCNDSNANIHPGAVEICNGLDDNCNGSIDEGLTFSTYYADNDHDGYGTGAGTQYCNNPGIGFSIQNGDCNDVNSAIHPNQSDNTCNHIDEDCDGLIDEDAIIPSQPLFNITQPTCSIVTGTITITNKAATDSVSFNNGVTYQISTIKSGLIAGNFTIVIKSINNCISSSNVAVINPPSGAVSTPILTIIQPTCSLATGSITITNKSATDSASFNNGISFQLSATKTGLIPGNYIVIVKKITGCISSGVSATINPQPSTPARPNLTLIQPTCIVTTGTITVTNKIAIDSASFDNGLTYQISNVKSGLYSGNYIIMLKSPGSCVSASRNATVNGIPANPPTPLFNIVQPTCAVSTGSITVTNKPSGDSVSFNNGILYQLSSTKNGLTAGSYTILIKSPAGCISNAAIGVINNAPIVPVRPILSVTQPTCPIPSGTIEVTNKLALDSASFDSGLTYQLSPIKSGLASAPYTVIIKSSTGCVSQTRNTTINALPTHPPTPNLNVTQPTCNTPTGTISVSNKARADSVSFNNGLTYQLGNSKNGLLPGAYQVIVKNTGLCLSNVSIATLNTPSITATINNLDTAYYKSAAAFTLNGTPSGGVFRLDGNSIAGNNFNPDVIPVGIHTVTYTVTQGACTNTATKQVNIKLITLPGEGSQCYTIQNFSSLNVSGSQNNAVANNSVIVQQTFSDLATQKWMLIDINGFKRIKNKGSNLYLKVLNNGNIVMGAPDTLVSEWVLVPNSASTAFALYNRSKIKYLTQSANGGYSLTNFTGAANQYFVFNSVNCPSSALHTNDFPMAEQIVNSDAHLLILSHLKMGRNISADLYPNPSEGRFTIIPHDLDLTKTTLLTIYSIVGNRIWESKVYNGDPIKVDLDIYNSTNGLYLLVIKNGDNILQKKFVID